MGRRNIQVKLDPAHGLDPSAHSLVLERVYPNHWISPDLYAAGATINLPLKGYESAIYEVYPVDSAHCPLLAGVTYAPKEVSGNTYKLDILKTVGNIKLLNPQKVTAVKVNGKESKVLDLGIPLINRKRLQKPDVDFNGNTMTTEMDFDENVSQPRFVVMLHPDSAFSGKPFPSGELMIDGHAVKATLQHQKGVWSVYSYELDKNVAGKHQIKFQINEHKDISHWQGQAELWLVNQTKVQPITVSFETKNRLKPRPMPPSPYDKDVLGNQLKLGAGMLKK